MSSDYYFHHKTFGLQDDIAKKMRIKMFEALMGMAHLNREATVLDVGVTVYRNETCNFFEKLYPYPHKITAVAIDDAGFLEKEFPGLKFVKADGLSLPFRDKSFDLAVSTATIEHVGTRQRQQGLVDELCRVARAVCITTPNRWYPMEFHTGLFFAHWLPAAGFQYICRCIGKDFLARKGNPNPLSKKAVLKMFPKGAKVRVKSFRLFGPVSNLMFYARV